MLQMMYNIPPESTNVTLLWKGKNMMRFGLNVEDKKTLVKRIGELSGQQPLHLRAQMRI